MRIPFTLIKTCTTHETSGTARPGPRSPPSAPAGASSPGGSSGARLRPRTAGRLKRLRSVSASRLARRYRPYRVSRVNLSLLATYEHQLALLLRAAPPAARRIAREVLTPFYRQTALCFVKCTECLTMGGVEKRDKA